MSITNLWRGWQELMAGQQLVVCMKKSKQCNCICGCSLAPLQDPIMLMTYSGRRDMRATPKLQITLANNMMRLSLPHPSQHDRSHFWMGLVCHAALHPDLTPRCASHFTPNTCSEREDPAPPGCLSAAAGSGSI